MIIITTEITIPASPEKVWNVLAQFDQYPHWNSFIPSISGELKVGKTLQVVIAPPEAKAMTFKPIVLKAEKPHEIRWAGKFIAEFLFRGEHYIQLIPIANGQTKVVHGEIFTGLLTPLFAKNLRGGTYQGFIHMNENLAAEVAKQKTNFS